ncbi:L-amino acid N-acyltransferase YncA [Prauserella shujinwangii]|uniref:L-amino acid N-acyltransferase YncA n=1 Tax=Prauserella shujinwangii TaxID=1453103 RepID=A0A2T0LZL2_9PSEU|nr:GNAT family N-acetyltransferase [Prauserella shujinwangii]PRX49553.1 L-amino acid N-acyltransferase YncA [Prauserella shujinwangii]
MVPWRLRVRLADRPGALARIAIRLADLECNILGLTVLPIPGGVLDEIVVRPATGLTRDLLAEAIRTEDCECLGITDADVHELVDVAAASLAAARRAVADPAGLADAVRAVLAADIVTVVPAEEGNPGRDEGGHRTVLPAPDGRVLVARRNWAPFAQLELARAGALLALLDAVRADLSRPAVATCADGATIVLREGRPADADAVLALHGRCSAATLFERYHTGTRSIPRRRLHRLLVPPRGRSLLAVCGRDVLGIGQLIPTAEPGVAELSLLVEDAWQRNGVGTALLRRLAALAVALGHRQLVANCLPGHDGVHRTAVRAGLAAVPGGDGGLRLPL